MLPAGRNQIALTKRQIDNCLEVWSLLDGNSAASLVVTEASSHSSRTRFNEHHRAVYLGAVVMPGSGINPNSRLSMLACLAHELAHAQRFLLGYAELLSCLTP